MDKVVKTTRDWREVKQWLKAANRLAFDYTLEKYSELVSVPLLGDVQSAVWQLTMTADSEEDQNNEQ